MSGGRASAGDAGGAIALSLSRESLNASSPAQDARHDQSLCARLSSTKRNCGMPPHIACGQPHCCCDDTNSQGVTVVRIVYVLQHSLAQGLMMEHRACWHTD